jgi:hypothetical protein
VIRAKFKDDPFTGDVFVFFNHARDRIKLILWDPNGFWLFYKGLEKGTFSFDLRGDGNRVETTRAQFSMILEVIDWKGPRSGNANRQDDGKTCGDARLKDLRECRPIDREPSVVEQPGRLLQLSPITLPLLKIQGFLSTALAHLLQES